MSRRGGRGRRSATAESPVARGGRAAGSAAEPLSPRPGRLATVRRKLRDLREVMVIPAIIGGFFLAIFLLVTAPQVSSPLHQGWVTDTVVKSERVTSGESSK